MLRFSTLGVFTATNNALVELLKRTKIQVCISMIFYDYNMTLNVLSLSTLNSSLKKTLVASLYTDVLV